MSTTGRRAPSIPSARIPPHARVRILRGLGVPALAGIGLSAVGASVYFILGVVAGDALGLTPVVFLGSSIFFLITAMTYIEGNSVHPERGGASSLARYAFDELWSFVAGWAILLDYVIVMAIGTVSIGHYLAAYWGRLDDKPVDWLIAWLAIGLVAWINIRGISPERMYRVLRLSLFNLVLMIAVVGIGLAIEFHPGQVIDSVHLGSAPSWRDLIFATVLATVAATGIEAASGLAPEVTVEPGGLKRLVTFTAAAVVVVLVGVSAVGLMTVPVHGTETALGGAYLEAPVLGIVSGFHPHALVNALRYLVGASAAVVLWQAVNGTMLGVSRLSYSLATNRQIPSALGKLHPKHGTPYVTVLIATAISAALAFGAGVRFLAGIFAFGAMIAFTIAHFSVIALRYKEPDAPRAFRIPLSVKIGNGSVPIPAAIGALTGLAAWISVIILHEGARYVGGAWMIGGIALYVIYRRGQDKSLTQRFTIPAKALQEAPEAEFGSILVPVFGTPLDDDIMGTAGRLAAEEGEEGEGGAVIEALYVVEVPMSLPLDARVPEEKITEAKRAVARAKEVGEEYEGVVVATAMVRARSAGAAIVAEAKRRGVEAIVLAAEEPTRVRGGALLGGRGGPRDRFVGEMTRYVVEKAPCRVILTAAPAGEEGRREGVAP
ncbi:MAG: amino acid permease [Thermoleophilaceae bacterium]